MSKMKTFSKEIGRRCSLGCETWPDDLEYEVCPICEEPTRLYRGVHPLDPAEALSKMRHAEFEAFYEDEWIPDDSPLTDDDLDRLGLRTTPDG